MYQKNTSFETRTNFYIYFRLEVIEGYLNSTHLYRQTDFKTHRHIEKNVWKWIFNQNKQNKKIENYWLILNFRARRTALIIIIHALRLHLPKNAIFTDRNEYRFNNRYQKRSFIFIYLFASCIFRNVWKKWRKTIF